MIRNRVLLAIGTALAACATTEEVRPADTAAESVVEVVARGMTLEAPSEIPSGWTTFRFSNESPMVHFAVIEKLPEGKGVALQQREVAPVFQAGLELLSAGDIDGAMTKFGELPAWFGEIVFMGGPGLTSPGQISEATVELSPGRYLLECYVKTGGVFHSYNPDPAVYGMVHEFTVTEVASGHAAPTAAVRLEISSEAGIMVEGVPSAGRQTFSVRFVDQTVHQNFVGHDVHLARLPDGADLATLETWMDWSQPTGLSTPSPVEFVGGLNEMPAGTTGFFTATLETGQYALISEVPGTRAKKMLQTFMVE